MSLPDRRVVACNYLQARSAVPRGARAYLSRPNPGGGNDRVLLLVRSRGGRWIEKWEPTKRLTNFRVVTLPPQHPRYFDERVWDHEPERAAAELEEATRA